MLRFSKLAQSTVKRTYQSKTVLTNKRFTQTKDTAKAKAVNTAMPKEVNTAKLHSTAVNVVRVSQVNAVKASACWVWRPTKLDSSSITLKKHNYIGKLQQDDTGFIDSGCLRHMTWNIAYLSDFKEFDGGYVTILGSEQSVFIKGRNILDGPLVLNEIMAWHRKRKKDLMVFKVDFEKAFDSLRWDFLDLVMVKLGFGTKWRKWIFGCLRNTHTFILVNGSPTCEFEIYMGLRKGDPLSPFLFILAMEGLHVLTCKAKSVGLFKGISFGHHNMRISHLIYVDDVIFLGEWSSVNAYNLLCMLRCFYLISGLKINVNKCNVLGVGVSNEEVSNLAKIIGCGAAKFLLKYLGVPVGGNMARCSNWNAIIQKFSSKLSLWKARLLSVGGRLSLIKSVLGSLPTYYMSIYMMPATVQKKLEAMRNKFFIGGDLDEKKITWVRWKKCLARKELGGLGIGSIYGLNIRLLFKWVWRFLSSPFDLLVRVIKNIHGEKETLSSLVPLRIDYLFKTEILFFDVIREAALGASNGYTIASVRSLVDSNLLDSSPVATHWNRSIPIKWFEWVDALHISNKARMIIKGVGVLCCGTFGSSETN
ncbi:putative RNA-directed DNA polymerase, eukaryota, reverse transcriptase zinc-binding domain protein [Tanacetum coccineum]